MLSPSDVRSTITKYVKLHDLMSSENKRYGSDSKKTNCLSRLVYNDLHNVARHWSLNILQHSQFRIQSLRVHRPVLTVNSALRLGNRLEEHFRARSEYFES